MTASRKEYWQDLLQDCNDVVFELSVSTNPEARATLIAALILADAMNGLRKSLLTVHKEQQNAADQ
jgi:hypothetical protein